MSVRAVCPECGATSSLEDSSATIVTCRQCGTKVPVPGAKPGPPPLPKSVAKSAPADEGFEVLDEDDDSSVAVADRDDSPPRTRRRPDDSDFDEEGRPAVRKRSVEKDSDYDRPRSRREEDEDEEDEPRPRRAMKDEDDEDEPRSRRTTKDESDEEDDDEPRSRRAAKDEPDEEDEDEPRSRRNPKVEEDEGDEPSSRSAGTDEEDEDEPRSRSTDDEEDDSEEYERRPRRTLQKKSKMPLILGGLLGFLALGVVGGAVAYFLWPTGKSDDTNVAQNNPPVEPGPGPKDPGGNPPIVPKVVEPKATEFARTKINLPGLALGVCTGNGGRHLLIHCALEKKLFVVGMAERRVVKEIETAGAGTIVTAGATKFLLVDTEGKKIERWDFQTLQKDGNGPLPFAGNVTEVVLGHSSDGPALVVSNNGGATGQLGFLNIETLAVADMTWNNLPAGKNVGQMTFRAAANGSAWMGTVRGRSTNAPIYIERDGNVAKYKSILRPQAGFGALSDDGVYAFSKHGIKKPAMVAASGSDRVNPSSAGTVPSLNGPFAVIVSNTNDKYLARIESHEPQHELVKIGEVPRPYSATDIRTPDQAILYSEIAGTLAILPETDPYVELIAVNLADEIKKVNEPIAYITSTPPIEFEPGKKFSYPVRVTSNRGGAKLIVNGIPATVSPDLRIDWDVPADFANPTVTVKIEAVAENARAEQSIVLRNRKPTNAPKVEPKKDPKSPDPKDPVVSKEPIAPGAMLVKSAAAAVPLPLFETAGERLEVPLAGPIKDLCVGGGGRYLILHVPTARKLFVFDVCTGQLGKSVGVAADNVLFAAGMDKLLVVYPDEKQVLRYSLPEIRLELDAELDMRPRPVAAGMGSATAGPLVLGGPVTQNNASKLALAFIDVETLKEVRVDKAEGALNIGFGSSANLRVSTYGTTLTLWYSQLQPSGVQIVRLMDNTLTGHHRAIGAGGVFPSATGQLIHTEKGTFTENAEPTKETGLTIPAVTRTWYLSIADGPGGSKTVSVRPNATDKPIKEFTTLPGFDGKKDPFERDNPSLAFDKRLILFPSQKALVVVAPAANKLYVYPLVK